MSEPPSPCASRIWEVAGVFLRLGAVGYGGPAVMGLMQSEVQERRQWLSKDGFIDGLALVNMLPGPGATQLGIYLGYVRAGLWGGILAGIAFMLPAFSIMVALTSLYTAYGAVPGMRRVFYGLNPVVVGILGVAAYRLGKAAIKDGKQVVIAILGGLAVSLTPLGIVPGLLLAGAIGVAVYYSRSRGLAAALLVSALWAAASWGGRWFPMAEVISVRHGGTPHPSLPGLWELGVFFGKVGAFTFGGGLTILAFLHDQVVNELQWLTRQEFLDGLALGQLTPGPILMLAAFVGYRTSGVWGAVMGAVAIFLPSFILVLSLVPVLDRVKHIAWMKAALRGISPAVIGMIAAALLQMLPKAVPDPVTGVMAAATIVAILVWRVGPLPLMAGGGAVGAALSFR